jgi:hypothetical protein
MMDCRLPMCSESAVGSNHQQRPIRVVVHEVALGELRQQGIAGMG